MNTFLQSDSNSNNNNNTNESMSKFSGDAFFDKVTKKVEEINNELELIAAPSRDAYNQLIDKYREEKGKSGQLTSTSPATTTVESDTSVAEATEKQTAVSAAALTPAPLATSTADKTQQLAELRAATFNRLQSAPARWLVSLVLTQLTNDYIKTMSGNSEVGDFEPEAKSKNEMRGLYETAVLISVS